MLGHATRRQFVVEDFDVNLTEYTCNESGNFFASPLVLYVTA